MQSETCQVCSTQSGRGTRLGLLLYPQPLVSSRGRNLQCIRGCAPYSPDAIWSTIAIMATPRRNETATIRVLVLDDGLVQREGIARVVEDAKAMTVAGMAATPAEALAILRERPVDLALVDLVLGDRRSGVEVGREMRRRRTEPCSARMSRAPVCQMMPSTSPVPSAMASLISSKSRTSCFCSATSEEISITLPSAPCRCRTATA
jgi:CheY-like chemotaxis protein